ncbi:MAG: hypothetical protein CMO80_02170 [Verrucomicrobiales bacterium]|nr:hypothetical protein [Verrucomicrobiales bacterium]|tara:strand:+ start:1085 stop:1285 length:201 start_codon:yes stop_codon:yes gene_type:complete
MNRVGILILLGARAVIAGDPIPLEPSRTVVIRTTGYWKSQSSTTLCEFPGNNQAGRGVRNRKNFIF